MSHVDYGEWVRLMERIVRRYLGGKRPRILEIGGGTGRLGGLLQRAGYEYTGSDRSFGMCREAAGRNVPLACADGRALPYKGCFDLAIFLYDGINYLGCAAEYEALFRETAGVLAPGGLFLFDITTEANSLAYFRDWLSFEDFGEASYVRHSYYDQKTRTQHNHFTLFTRGQGHSGCYAKSEEHHRQLVLPAAAICGFVPKELFEVLGMWDGYSFDKCGRRSERVHFLLRRRAV
jgi:SAM-dependent methyltransferase